MVQKEIKNCGDNSLRTLAVIFLYIASDYLAVLLAEKFALDLRNILRLYNSFMTIPTMDF